MSANCWKLVLSLADIFGLRNRTCRCTDDATSRNSLVGPWTAIQSTRTTPMWLFSSVLPIFYNQFAAVPSYFASSEMNWNFAEMIFFMPSKRLCLVPRYYHVVSQEHRIPATILFHAHSAEVMRDCRCRSHELQHFLILASCFESWWCIRF